MSLFRSSMIFVFVPEAHAPVCCLSLLRSFNADCAKAVLKRRYSIGRGVSPCKIASATVWLRSLSVAEMPDVKSESPFGSAQGADLVNSFARNRIKSNKINFDLFDFISVRWTLGLNLLADIPAKPLILKTYINT